LTFEHQGSKREAQLAGSCSQIFKMRRNGTDLQRVSSAKEFAVGASFMPQDARILFSSTDAYGSTHCVADLTSKLGSIQTLDQDYQLYAVRPDGTDKISTEPAEPRAYNGEATACQDGTIVFVSDRTGNLELYKASLDFFGTFTHIQRITQSLGLNSSPAISPDCKQIVWQASRPRIGKELHAYQRSLRQHIAVPQESEIWTAQIDGTHAHSITRLKSLSITPTFAPDGNTILFSSNFGQSPSDRNPLRFSLYSIHLNGTQLTQISHPGASSLETSPAFSPNGKYLVFSAFHSNTASSSPPSFPDENREEFNLFLTTWNDIPNRPLQVDSPEAADRFLATVEHLAQPKMEGRGLGTPGLKLAESFVAERFLSLGLVTVKAAFHLTDPKVPESFEIPVQITLSKGVEVVNHNILGVWGQGCQSLPPIVIGAHLDHLGYGSSQSLEPAALEQAKEKKSQHDIRHDIHPGADDNASGVAAMLEVARMVQNDPSAQSQCFIFAAFTAEEFGIVGSTQAVQWMKALHIRPKAMLNLDMVGRMENNTLIAFGSDSAREWNSILSTECSQLRLQCPGGGDGFGPSDHMAFYLAEIPVLHFFTGPHLDYHRTTDTVEKINSTGGIQTAELVSAIALRVAKNHQGLHYQKPSSTPQMKALVGSEQKKVRTYLGTIPDYSTLMSPHGLGGGGEPAGGVKLAGVRPGSPADQAGIRANDIIKGIVKKGSPNDSILTLQDFTDALVKLEPGDQAVVTIERAGKLLHFSVTLAEHP
jgi:Tol biopolymer transport system component